MTDIHNLRYKKPRNPTTSCEVKMAVLTGLEPAASGVTGRRYNQLNYSTIFAFLKKVGVLGLEPRTLSL